MAAAAQEAVCADRTAMRLHAEAVLSADDGQTASRAGGNRLVCFICASQ